MSAAFRIEQLGKAYQLGVSDQRALFTSWWRKLRGVPEEYFWALKDISFEVQEGEVVGVIGHNGAGKSTLLKILSQITTPTCGRALIRGRVASLLEVGTGFHLELTGRENVFLNGAILGMTHKEVSRRFDEIVDFAQGEQFIDTPVKRYSSGMRVRLAFAVAAHLECEILIIDEVLAVGDASFQAKCMGKIGAVAGSGRTVLFVSHSAATVESLCTRGIVLDHGKLVYDGGQLAALQHYSNLLGAAATCLLSRGDRRGTGEVRATAVEVRSLEGEPIVRVRSGEGVEVWVHYEQRDGARLAQMVCDLALLNVMGTPLITQSSSFGTTEMRDLPPRGYLVCRIPTLPLAEGAYRFDLGLFPALRRRHPYDDLHNVAELHVVPSDFFGTGKMPRTNKGDGMFLVRGEWRVEETLPAEGAVAPSPGT